MIIKVFIKKFDNIVEERFDEVNKINWWNRW